MWQFSEGYEMKNGKHFVAVMEQLEVVHLQVLKQCGHGTIYMF